MHAAFYMEAGNLFLDKLLAKSINPPTLCLTRHSSSAKCWTTTKASAAWVVPSKEIDMWSSGISCLMITISSLRIKGTCTNWRRWVLLLSDLSTHAILSNNSRKPSAWCKGMPDFKQMWLLEHGIHGWNPGGIPCLCAQNYRTVCLYPVNTRKWSSGYCYTCYFRRHYSRMPGSKCTSIPAL